MADREKLKIQLNEILTAIMHRDLMPGNDVYFYLGYHDRPLIPRKNEIHHYDLRLLFQEAFDYFLSLQMETTTEEYTHLEQCLEAALHATYPVFWYKVEPVDKLRVQLDGKTVMPNNTYSNSFNYFCDLEIMFRYLCRKFGRELG